MERTKASRAIIAVVIIGLVGLGLMKLWQRQDAASQPDRGGAPATATTQSAGRGLPAPSDSDATSAIGQDVNASSDTSIDTEFRGLDRAMESLD